jgi:hypothetical protein
MALVGSINEAQLSPKKKKKRNDSLGGKIQNTTSPLLSTTKMCKLAQLSGHKVKEEYETTIRLKELLRTKYADEEERKIKMQLDQLECEKSNYPMPSKSQFPTRFSSTPFIHYGVHGNPALH